MSSPAVLSVKVPPTGVLILAASSANLGLAILSPVITILRDDFSASADRVSDFARRGCCGLHDDGAGDRE